MVDLTVNYEYIEEKIGYKYNNDNFIDYIFNIDTLNKKTFENQSLFLLDIIFINHLAKALFNNRLRKKDFFKLSYQNFLELIKNKIFDKKRIVEKVKELSINKFIYSEDEFVNEKDIEDTIILNLFNAILYTIYQDSEKLKSVDKFINNLINLDGKMDSLIRFYYVKKANPVKAVANKVDLIENDLSKFKCSNEVINRFTKLNEISYFKNSSTMILSNLESDGLIEPISYQYIYENDMCICKCFIPEFETLFMERGITWESAKEHLSILICYEISEYIKRNSISEINESSVKSNEIDEYDFDESDLSQLECSKKIIDEILKLVDTYTTNDLKFTILTHLELMKLIKKVDYKYSSGNISCICKCIIPEFKIKLVECGNSNEKAKENLNSMFYDAIKDYINKTEGVNMSDPLTINDFSRFKCSDKIIDMVKILREELDSQFLGSSILDKLEIRGYIKKFDYRYVLKNNEYTCVCYIPEFATKFGSHGDTKEVAKNNVNLVAYSKIIEYIKKNKTITKEVIETKPVQTKNTYDYIQENDFSKLKCSDELMHMFIELNNEYSKSKLSITILEKLKEKKAIKKIDYQYNMGLKRYICQCYVPELDVKFESKGKTEISAKERLNSLVYEKIIDYIKTNTNLLDNKINNKIDEKIENTPVLTKNQIKQITENDFSNFTCSKKIVNYVYNLSKKVSNGFLCKSIISELEKSGLIKKVEYIYSYVYNQFRCECYIAEFKTRFSENAKDTASALKNLNVLVYTKIMEFIKNNPSLIIEDKETHPVETKPNDDAIIDYVVNDFSNFTCSKEIFNNFLDLKESMTKELLSKSILNNLELRGLIKHNDYIYSMENGKFVCERTIPELKCKIEAHGQIRKEARENLNNIVYLNMLNLIKENNISVSDTIEAHKDLSKIKCPNAIIMKFYELKQDFSEGTLRKKILDKLLERSAINVMDYKYTIRNNIFICQCFISEFNNCFIGEGKKKKEARENLNLLVYNKIIELINQSSTINKEVKNIQTCKDKSLDKTISTFDYSKIFDVIDKLNKNKTLSIAKPSILNLLETNNIIKKVDYEYKCVTDKFICECFIPELKSHFKGEATTKKTAKANLNISVYESIIKLKNERNLIENNSNNSKTKGNNSKTNITKKTKLKENDFPRFTCSKKILNKIIELKKQITKKKFNSELLKHLEKRNIINKVNIKYSKTKNKYSCECVIPEFLTKFLARGDTREKALENLNNCIYSKIMELINKKI